MVVPALGSLRREFQRDVFAHIDDTLSSANTGASDHAQPADQESVKPTPTARMKRGSRTSSRIERSGGSEKFVSKAFARGEQPLAFDAMPMLRGKVRRRSRIDAHQSCIGMMRFLGPNFRRG